ncbi:helix-turn-helix transcriptional regulator [Saccharospirillum salsuginis]|uniref:helix-turn-helix transcriptional regulator n=1 Tax=Saccharospirillum salsuginis TaxID=418750 RepID=UPI001677BF7F
MQRIRYYRELAGLTQWELGKKCGFKSTQSRIAQYERGGRIPPLPIARIIVKALNQSGVKCSLDDVFPADKVLARR